MSKCVCNEEEMGWRQKCGYTLWRTETELQTEADEGDPWEKLEVQTKKKKKKWCTDVVSD